MLSAVNLLVQMDDRALRGRFPMDDVLQVAGTPPVALACRQHGYFTKPENSSSPQRGIFFGVSRGWGEATLPMQAMP